MPNRQTLKDDILYYSNAWETLLSLPVLLAVAAADLYSYGLQRSMLLYAALFLFIILYTLYALRKARIYRRAHPECTPEMKRKELRDKLFYDRAKKYFIGAAVILALLLWILLDGIFSHRWITVSSLLISGYTFLDLLVRGILSLRYERQQHLEFLKEHPEYEKRDG